MNSDVMELVGIAVAENGWSNQVFGVPNALTTIKKFGCPNIPVAFGTPNSLTVLNLQQNAELPPEDWLWGIDHLFEESCHISDPTVEGLPTEESEILP